MPSSTEQPSRPMTEDEAFKLALSQLNEEYPDVSPQDGQQVTPEEPHQDTARAEQPSSKSLLQKGVDLWKSAGAGIAKAGFETKDFLFGEPAEEDKWDIRRGIEQRSKELAGESTANAMTMGIAQLETRINPCRFGRRPGLKPDCGLAVG